jgi:hypothetical protein
METQRQQEGLTSLLMVSGEAFVIPPGIGEMQKLYAKVLDMMGIFSRYYSLSNQ